MVERRMGIIAFLLCLCLCLTPCCARAASTADAKEAISPDKECTLTLSYRYNGKAFSDVTVKLYKIANVSADFQYTLTEPFVSSGLALNGIQSTKEWNVIRTTLEARILSNEIGENCKAVTNGDGKVTFESLKPGLYLAVNETVKDCSFDSALVVMPGLGTDGLWQYQLEVSSKGQEIPPVNPDEEIDLKILKLWKEEAGQNIRPTSIRVEIFRDGKSYKTVTLFAENNWSYQWTAKDDGATWTIVEQDVPQGYVMTVEKRGATFVLTNTRSSNGSSSSGGDVPPADTPKTGDSVSALVYTALMYVSGAILVILGLTGKRKRT